MYANDIDRRLSYLPRFGPGYKPIVFCSLIQSSVRRWVGMLEMVAIRWSKVYCMLSVPIIPVGGFRLIV